jgi:hypothetical protein
MKGQMAGGGCWRLGGHRGGYTESPEEGETRAEAEATGAGGAGMVVQVARPEPEQGAAP